MSEFDDQYGDGTYSASDFQREDYGLDVPGAYSPKEYRDTENQLMGWGVQSDNLPTSGVWQDPSGMYHAGPSGGGSQIGDTEYDWGWLDQWDASLDKDLAASRDAERQQADRYNSLDLSQPTDNSTWAGRTGGSGGGSTSYNVGGGGSGYTGPTFEYPELNVPEFEYGAKLDLPDYEPPEYDEEYERATREEYIQSMKGSLEKGVSEAILNSASMDNPNARAKLIQGALEGFGEALKGAALTGSEQGRKAASDKYGRDVGVYNVQFETTSQEVIADYNNQLKEDLLNWEMNVKELEAQYNIDYQNYMSMPVEQRGEATKEYDPDKILKDGSSNSPLEWSFGRWW